MHRAEVGQRPLVDRVTRHPCAGVRPLTLREQSLGHDVGAGRQLGPGFVAELRAEQGRQIDGDVGPGQQLTVAHGVAQRGQRLPPGVARGERVERLGRGVEHDRHVRHRLERPGQRPDVVETSEMAGAARLQRGCVVDGQHDRDVDRLRHEVEGLVESLLSQFGSGDGADFMDAVASRIPGARCHESAFLTGDQTGWGTGIDSLASAN